LSDIPHKFEGSLWHTAHPVHTFARNESDDGQSAGFGHIAFDGENRRYAEEARKEAGKVLINLYLEKPLRDRKKKTGDGLYRPSNKAI
jgi:hypothetical protein